MLATQSKAKLNTENTKGGGQPYDLSSVKAVVISTGSI
jgi:hypothetical protein